MTHVTYRLTAKCRDQLRNPMLGNRVWATFFSCLFYVNFRSVTNWLNCSQPNSAELDCGVHRTRVLPLFSVSVRMDHEICSANIHSDSCQYVRTMPLSYEARSDECVRKVEATFRMENCLDNSEYLASVYTSQPVVQPVVQPTGRTF